MTALPLASAQQAVNSIPKPFLDEFLHKNFFDFHICSVSAFQYRFYHTH